VAAPRELDLALVRAQEARRVLDRLCGYTVSGPLSRAANERLSAGRVQSPALRLVVERERAIVAFVSVAHFGAELVFDGGWKALWNTKPWLPKDADYLLDEVLAGRASAIRSLNVESCEEKESKVASPAPFTTSSLQQAASNALKFSPKRTMELAQRLYESGSTTYIRTDSPNLSQEAVDAVRTLAKAQGWPLPTKPRVWKSKDGAQEAHEAIRPTHPEVEEAGENPDEQALYRLIRLRALASQLADAVYDVRTLRLSAPLDGKSAEFEARGRTLKETGWKVLLADDEASSDENEDAPDNPVPALDKGTAVSAVDGRILRKSTKPPARFSEASLIRELENRGIGRPATFAAIVDTILRRAYVRIEKGKLLPTPLGEKALDLLAGAFSFADYEFTKEMESALDEIAAGHSIYKDVLTKANECLQTELAAFALAHAVSLNAAPSSRSKPELSKFKCKACGKPLVRRNSTRGPFFGCSGYPNCKNTYPDRDGKPDFEVAKTKKENKK
jgi:DNA topoisomerase-1